MAAKLPALTEEEMAIDEASGYPKAYAKLCSTSLNPYIHGPPRIFVPYTLEPQEALRAKELNQMFPVIDPEAKPSTNPRGYVNLLWKRLDHLGNAGFDPALFRVDHFGNVLYLHADSASPLAWDIDHWFPCSRGGKTLPGNLRLLQWQVCKKKRNKLDFVLPWWDLQLGISVSQFLSIFASRNSDFRNRAFSFLFSDGGSEELNSLQTIESHSFPQHFIDMKQKVGLAPAAIVTSQRSHDTSVLKSLDVNRSLRQNSPFPASRKFSVEDDDTFYKSMPNVSKENQQPETDEYSDNPYISITKARDSLRQREEYKKNQAEINGLDEELDKLKQKNEEERVALQDLEAVLIKRRRRVEKCRRLAEAQASYRTMLEKMIRDAMHQSVVYKEQVRLNQVASSTLMARLEAQRAICDTSENELRRKFKQRDEIEKQIRPCWEEQARKRSRMDDTLFEERHEGTARLWNPMKKELRVFLEEEQKASEGTLCHDEEQEEESLNFSEAQKDTKCKAVVLASDEMKHRDECRKMRFRELGHETMDVAKDELALSHKLKELAIRGKSGKLVPSQNEIVLNNNEVGIREGSYSKNTEMERQTFGEENEEYRNQVGKGNIDKWLHMMLENAKEGSSSSSDSPPRDRERVDNSTEEIVQMMNLINPQKETKYLKLPLEGKSHNGNNNQNKQPMKESSSFSDNKRSAIVDMRIGSRKSFEVKENRSVTPSCESSRGFRSFPSSPSMILGMRRGVDCMGKKPKVMNDSDEEGNLDLANTNSNKFIRTYSKTIKKAVHK